MPATTSLLIADSQELIRLGVRAMLTGTSIKIVGEAPDATSTLTLAKKHKPAGGSALSRLRPSTNDPD